MNPTPEAVAKIRAHVTDWSPDDATIAAALNAPAVANPVPQGAVPRRFAAKDMALACSAGNRPNLASVLAGSGAALIIGQDAYHLGLGLDAMAAIGAISVADADAMKAVMGQTDPDPSWQAQIGWAQANIGRPADRYDIAAARPQGS